MKLSTTGGGHFSLTGLKGLAVIYFYPRDNTPGCTTEGQDFAAAYKAFARAGVAIYGVSADTLSSHEKFKTKFSFPFELVSDPDWELCQKFGVIKMKSLYGRKFEGIERSTFLVGARGKILQEWRGVKVKGHVAEVLAAVKELA